uniref:Novel zinc finger protein n=1 Tax=Xenopus tropicalis TaxID=8364 RepID=Q28BY5_XENTR|nr:novel zinc finger protein [Xenopus tropicalis]
MRSQPGPTPPPGKVKHPGGAPKRSAPRAGPRVAPRLQTMSSQDVTVKKEQSEEEEEPQPAAWPDKTKEANKKKMNDRTEEVPAEICVVIGDNRKQQSAGENSPERQEAAMSRETSWSGSGRQRNIPPRISTSSPGSYECGICRKKYKYYNCFQTHVRAHIDNESASGEGASQGNNFRYTCDICGKKYKYYSCFQEHRDLHAVDDTYIHMMVTAGDSKEEDSEPFLKLGPKTGNYTCEYCGKQYKYYTPYQEHVALHAPIKRAFSPDVESRESKTANNYDETNSNSQHSSGSSRTHAGMADMVAGGNVTSWQKDSSNPMIGSPFPLVQDNRKPYLSPTKTSPCMNSGRGSAPKQEVEPRGELDIGKGWKKKIKRKEETNNKAPAARDEKGAKTEEPYTCGACGIQFQFYNNLLEHMQSHAADNENNIPTNQSRTAPPTEEHWKAQPPRNNANNSRSLPPVIPAPPEIYPATSQSVTGEFSALTKYL